MFTRRGALQIGTLGLGGLTLPGLWQRQAQAGTTAKNTSVILFWMAGGPSHIDTYDMKPKAPEIVRGPFKAVDTNLAGFQVCELLPRHAAVADRVSIVRSITHDLSVHDDAQHWLQTGYPLLNARQRGQQFPTQGSAVAKFRGPNHPDMPAYVCIPEDYQSHLGFYQTASFLGPQYNALNAGGDPTVGNYRLPEFNLPQSVSLERLNGRRELLRHVDPTADTTLDVLQQKAFDLLTGSRVRQALDFQQEPPSLREQYGRHAYGQSALMARRLVEAGATFVTINLYEKDVDWWDDHYTIEKNLRKRLPPYDQALGTLLLDLEDRGLAETTLVIATGEFGRSPKIDGGAGRGHWPRAMSVLLSGGGVKPGVLVGATTPDGGEPADHALRPGDLLATIYDKLGIDPETMVHDRQNRPMPLVPEGRPIEEL